MVVEKPTANSGTKYHSIDEDIFDIRGVFRENGVLVKLPKAVAESISDGIAYNYRRSAGGRVRFITDSPYVSVSARLTKIFHFPIMAISGTSGIDVYADGHFCGIVRPEADKLDLNISATVNMRSNGEHLIEINLPLYSGIEEMEIGLDENAVLKPAPDYTHNKPIVFYGSSITNGASSTRPGLSYPSRISRILDTDYINLGFGGLCKAEQKMMDYMQSQ